MNKIKKIKGAIIILVLMVITIIMGFAAFSVDGGHLFVVRNELQNAADAAALAGASYIYPPDTSGNFNWSLAQTKALERLADFKSDGVTLSTATIVTGYWDLTGANPNIHSVPPGGTAGVQNLPAIQVSVYRQAGINGGPVTLFFGKFLGISTMNISARAVAVVGSVSSVSGQQLFPVALPETVYNTYWDKAAGKPKNDPSTGKPYIFNIGVDGTNGQWTSFQVDANDVGTITNLMSTGNPNPLKIGDSIWIESGVKTTIYSSVPTNKDVAIAVVDSTGTHAQKQITAFGAIHIISSTGGSTKAITVQLLNSYVIANAEPGGGSLYGIYTRPRLAK